MSDELTLEALGWDADWARISGGVEGTPCRVVRQDRGWVQVADADGVRSARTRADRVGTPVVGDWVTVIDDEVASVLPRRNVLRRADPVGEGEQVLAANLDRVAIVLGLDRPVKTGRIQRVLVQACDAGAGALVVLSKADLVAEPSAVAAAVAAEHPGVDVVATSSEAGIGIDELRDRIAGEVTVLLGESGAGKSSLLNVLGGSELAEVGEVRDSDAKGRHTTTRRELHLLPAGGLVVDTPGVRAIGIHADQDAIDCAFPDVSALAGECRFGDCSHDQEPGCAVRAAIAADALDPARLEAYRDLLAEAAWALRPDHERRGRR